MTGEQSNSITEAVSRELTALQRELNTMPDRLPTVRSLPDVLKKALGMVEDAAQKLVGDIEAMGEHGNAVMGNVGGVVKDVRDTFEEVQKAVEGSSNGGPLSQG